MSVFLFNWKITLKNKCLTTYNWYNIFEIHVLSLITVEFLLFSKTIFTTNAQNVLHLDQCTHGHVWSWTVAGFLKVLRRLQMVWQAWKCVGELSLCYQLELNKLGVFEMSLQIKTYWTKFGRQCRLHNYNYVGGHMLIQTFSSFSCGKNTHEGCQAFWVQIVHHSYVRTLRTLKNYLRSDMCQKNCKDWDVTNV
jgi:hypothetical protein